MKNFRNTLTVVGLLVLGGQARASGCMPNYGVVEKGALKGQQSVGVRYSCKNEALPYTCSFKDASGVAYYIDKINNSGNIPFPNESAAVVVSTFDATQKVYDGCEEYAEPISEKGGVLKTFEYRGNTFMHSRF